MKDIGVRHHFKDKSRDVESYDYPFALTSKLEEDLDEDENEDVPINEYIFLIDEQKFAFVKSQNDENLFECIIKNKPSPFKSNHSNLD